MDHCLKEEDWGKVKSDMEFFKSKVCKHVNEGDRPGGYRDRLLIAEKEISIIKKGYWIAAVVAGAVGGLIGKLTPDLVSFFIKQVFAK